MKISTTVALLCLASFASAQSKFPTEKAQGIPGNYGPPQGVSFLVAGGSDDCANALANDSITGLGTYAVITTGATTGVTPQTASTIKNDVWFLWTSTVTGPVIFNTCGGASVDTKLGVWIDNNGGACPSGTSIAYNDDFCGLQSQVTFPATNGTTYFLQLGAFTEGVTYSGTFTLSTPPPPPVNDNCATPTAISGSGLVPINTTTATTGLEGQAEGLCFFYSTSTINKDLWFTWTPSMTGLVDVSTCGQMTIDTRIAVYDGAGCPVAGAIACNDDQGYPGSYTCVAYNFSATTSFNAVCGQLYTIQIGTYSSTANAVGNFAITEMGTMCTTPSVPYCFGDGTGSACPCANNGTAGNGCANSVNAAGGNLASTGNASIAADTLVLQGSGMPSSSALYFQGTSQISSAFGDGLRCVGGTVIRLGTKANVAGASSYPVPGDQSVSVRGMVAAGNVRDYQVWYRNAAAFCTPSTFNLTNGLEVTWGL